MTQKFSIDIKEIKDLNEVQNKPADVKQQLARHGGVVGLIDKLKVNPLKGLSNEDKQDLADRQEKFGRNEIPAKPPKRFIVLMWEAVQDTTLVILTICAVISLVLSFVHLEDAVTTEEYLDPNKQGMFPTNVIIILLLSLFSSILAEPNVEWIEGFAILAAVLVVVLVTSFNDWSKERQFRGLQSKIDSDQKINVLRDGVINEKCVKDILVGDICHISYGNSIPTDGFVLESNDLKVDEASLTGEAALIKKDAHEKPILFSGTYITLYLTLFVYISILIIGTNVMEGSAKMLVTAVGLNSQTGIIMSLLMDTDEKKKDEKKKEDKKKTDKKSDGKKSNF